MPKLFFRYGAMNSSKTANLLMAAHNYRSTNRRVIVIKPSVESRDGENVLSSRIGIERDVDFLITPEMDIRAISLEGISCLFADEAQFLTPEHVDQLREITLQVPVICYGLRTDYKTHLFPGSKRLVELADAIEEVKTICMLCNRKAIVNGRYTQQEGCELTIIREGSDEIDLGAEDKYVSMCWKCWHTSD
jgi:thymidine kinase